MKLLLDLDPLETATCMTYVIGALGLTYICLPQLLFSIFGGKHSPLNHRLVQTYGSGVLGTIITIGYCLIIKETSLALTDPVHIRVSPLHIWKGVGLLQTQSRDGIIPCSLCCLCHDTAIC